MRKGGVNCSRKRRCGLKILVDYGSAEDLVEQKELHTLLGVLGTKQWRFEVA